jgi:hypothetical protein
MTRSTKANPMTTLLMRSERLDPIFNASEVGGWKQETLERFVQLGLLAEADSASSFSCDACGFDHVEPVEWVRTPGLPARVCIRCPEAGLVWLNPDDLHRWVVRPPALAQGVASVVGAAGSVSERVTGRVWKLGTIRVGGRSWVAFLGIGFTRPGTASVVDCVPELVAANALVFVPSTAPPLSIWGTHKPAAIVLLCDFISLGANGLVADATFLESALPPLLKVVPKGPTHAFPTPAGTTWEQVSLTVDDLHVVVRVGNHSQQFGFADAGFENKRKKGSTDELWTLLNLFARQGGVLGTGDHITTKPGKLKQKVSKLRDRLQALVALDNDPFHPNTTGQPYRTRFTIRRAGPATFPTPPGSNWDDITITEVTDGVIEIELNAEERDVTFVGADDPTERGRWEGTTKASERQHRFTLADLGLTGPNPTPAGEALVAVLRGGGRLSRPTMDKGMLALGDVLTRFFQLEDPPFTFDQRRRQWVAQFEASSVVARSDR